MVAVVLKSKLTGTAIKVKSACSRAYQQSVLLYNPTACVLLAFKGDPKRNAAAIAHPCSRLIRTKMQRRSSEDPRWILNGFGKAKGLHWSIRTDEPTLCPSVMDYMVLITIEDVYSMIGGEHIAEMAI